MQWNPDRPLVVRGGSLDRKDKPKITSLLLMGRDEEIKTRLILF